MVARILEVMAGPGDRAIFRELLRITPVAAVVAAIVTLQGQAASVVAETEAVEVMRFQRKERMDLAVAAEQQAEVLRAALVLAAVLES